MVGITWVYDDYPARFLLYQVADIMQQHIVEDLLFISTTAKNTDATSILRTARARTQVAAAAAAADVPVPQHKVKRKRSTSAASAPAAAAAAEDSESKSDDV